MGMTAVPADERRTLLTGFGGFMLMLSGAVTVVQGLWALDHKNDRAIQGTASRLSYGNLETWGWIMLSLGVVAFVVSFAVFTGKEWSRWAGIVVSSLSVLFMFFWVFAFPLAAIGVIIIDIVVISSLFSLGREPAA